MDLKLLYSLNYFLQETYYYVAGGGDRSGGGWWLFLVIWKHTFLVKNLPRISIEIKWL